MLRRLHSLPGLLLAALVTVTALSGAFLALGPVQDGLGGPSLRPGTSIGSLAAAAAALQPGLERIEVRPTGVVTAEGADGTVRIDPATGASLGPFAAPTAPCASTPRRARASAPSRSRPRRAS